MELPLIGRPEWETPRFGIETMAHPTDAQGMFSSIRGAEFNQYIASVVAADVRVLYRQPRELKLDP